MIVQRYTGLTLFIALLAGALLPTAFAPFNIYPIAFLSPALFLWLCLFASPRKAWCIGGCFGIGMFTTGTYWIFISINTYGNTPLFISLFITALFVGILAFYFACLGYGLRKFSLSCTSTPVVALTLFPALWVIIELVRARLFSGFPWLLLGYTQLHTPLRGFAPIIGVYGLSLLTVMISGCLMILFTKHSSKLKITIAGGLLLVFVGGWLLSKQHWTTTKTGDTIKASLVQGNIPQTLKWDPTHLMTILKTYANLSEKHWSSQLIIWPEAAIPIFPEQIPDYVDAISAEARDHGTYLLTGIPLMDSKSKQYYNGILLLGAGHGRYLKRHLVPFGEYFPLKPLLGWFANYFKVPMSDFSPGPPQQPPLNIAGHHVAPFICYEIAFPEEVLRTTKNTQLLIAITDDSWFGRSIAAAQQLQMAEMRGLETGRYVLQVSNTGLTAISNAKGQTVARAPRNQRIVITHTVPFMSGKTPLMHFGYYPVWGIIFLLIIIFSAWLSVNAD